MQDDHIRNTFVLEDRIWRAGASCLHSIIRYYGIDYSSFFLRRISGTNRHGTSLFRLFHAAFSLGFNVSLFEIQELSSLRKVQPPFIMHIESFEQSTNFVVVYQVFAEHLLIGHPQAGLVFIDTAKLEPNNPGYMILHLAVRHSLNPISKLDQFKLILKKLWISILT